MLSTKWMKLKPSPDIVETFAKYRWELSCGAWERSVEDGSAWDVASAQHGHQPPSLDTKCSQGVTPLPGTSSSITIIIIIIIIIMAIVKWSEDIGTLHSVVCVLYGMLKSLNSCLICLALWKYEYGFWLFVERKRLFYYILHGDCSDEFFLVSIHIRIEGISPNIVHLLWSLSLKLCILYLNPIILNAKKCQQGKEQGNSSILEWYHW